MFIETIQTNQSDRKELIQSYGFVEQISSNKNFLNESLELASRISGAKMAYISLLDGEHQFILSQHEAELQTIPVEESICQFTIKKDEITVIENTREHELTKVLHQVSKEDGILFYAGCPLVNSNNIKIGALCVMDTKPNTLTQTQKDTLMVLAKQVMTTLDNQRSMIKLIKKINQNFRPAACADFNCLSGELDHLQEEVVVQNKLIKDQKQLLENSNSELLNFANMVAHDVRAPLRSINSFISLHERELVKCNKEFDREYLSFIKQATINLDELTNDLLSYAKSGADSVKNEKLNLQEILQTVTLNLTETINSSNAEVVLPEGDFFIHGKKLQMVQLFQNLISNGLKYQDGEKKPRIVVEANTILDKVRVSVTDNGIGMSKDNLEKIFEPFQRLQTVKEYKGSGIGLATCKKIIDTLDSQFVVTSELGEGSTFTFDLPKYG